MQVTLLLIIYVSQMIKTGISWKIGPEFKISLERMGKVRLSCSYMASNTREMGYLPSGGAICCTIPDILYLPELVFGGLVWCLVAPTYILPYNPQAYVMAVSLFCFIMTFLWMMIFACGAHRNRSSCAGADVLYHALAALLYLSASVLLALVTIGFSEIKDTILYKLNVAAVVFAFTTTLLYVIHTIFSAIRWKSF